LAAALVAALVCFKRVPQDEGPAPWPAVRFVDVTERSGIRFTHTSGATSRKLLPATMGAGVAGMDFDPDGRPHPLSATSRPGPGRGQGPPPTIALYRNKGAGTFEDVTKAMHLDVPLYGMGATVGDSDNGGWPDLFVTAVGGNRLFRNLGGKRFADV